MSTVTLNEMDVRAFLTAFNAIAEVTSFDFTDETEYRLAIANLVGDLKSQLAAVPRELISVTPRVNLAEVLVAKYGAWNVECSGGAVCQSADSLVAEYLDKSEYDRKQFIGGTEAVEAVGQLRAILTAGSIDGWDRYELVLCSSSRDELDRLKLSDLLEVLFVTDSGTRTGSSFWGRWKK